MDKNTTAAGALRMQRLAKALEGNNSNVVCLDSKEQVIPALEKLIRKGGDRFGGRLHDAV